MFDLVHIGDYKTGTTWLQKHAFQQHPEIICADNPAVYPEIAKLFYELVLVRDLDFEPKIMRERFLNEVGKIDRSGKRLVVSRESLFGNFLSGENSRRIAERMFQVFGPIKILLVIREQFSMLASIYSQYVKIGGSLSLRDFIWDPFVSKDLIARLQYEKVIRAYVDIFGPENISIRLFEDMKGDNDSFLNYVYTLSGCENTNFTPGVNGRTNPSLTTAGAVVQRILNRFVRTQVNPNASMLPFDKIIASLLPLSKKESLLDSARIQLPDARVDQVPEAYLVYAVNMGMNLKLSVLCEKIQFGRKIEVPFDLREQLTAEFIPGNRILLETYGLSLNKHGWVL
jgi:hypothetical protein